MIIVLLKKTSYDKSIALAGDELQVQDRSMVIYNSVDEFEEQFYVSKMDGVAAQPLHQATKSGSYVTPLLVRSGNTKKVELYLKYKGDRANAIRFKKLVS